MIVEMLCDCLQVTLVLAGTPGTLTLYEQHRFCNKIVARIPSDHLDGLIMQIILSERASADTPTAPTS